MAEILIEIKIEGNSNALAFVERTQPYLSQTLSKVGDLLPQNFKFVRTGIPVSAIQKRKKKRRTASSKVHKRGRERQNI